MAEHTLSVVVGERERDLWAEALQKLPEEDKKLIGVSSRKELDIAEEVLKTAKSQQEKCVSKEYSFKFDGKDISIRQVLGNVMDWVEKFKKIIDFAVSLDKSGHTALPWACINFVLEVSITHENPLRSSELQERH
jgi:hypothetical protein